MCGYMDQCYLPFLYVVSQKMISHFYVVGFGMEHWVLCNTYGTGAVTLKWDMSICQMVRSEQPMGVFNPCGLVIRRGGV
jgi:hypothetical protein